MIGINDVTIIMNSLVIISLCFMTGVKVFLATIITIPAFTAPLVTLVLPFAVPDGNQCHSHQCHAGFSLSFASA